MSKEEFISTGIEKLDALLEGGAPKGYAVLILGTPGSSIEILSKQLATTGKVLYFTTEETETEVLDTMKRFGWSNKDIRIVDIASRYSETILSGEEKRVSVYEQRSKIKLKELIEIGSSGTPPIQKGGEDFLAILSNEIKNTPCEKIIINSLDFFPQVFPGKGQQQFTSRFLHRQVPFISQKVPNLIFIFHSLLFF